MTNPGSWLSTRKPTPPADLGARLPDTDGLEGAELVEVLAESALAALDRARANPGRVRESALDLLVADALLTYACEAALEVPDADALLSELLSTAASLR